MKDKTAAGILAFFFGWLGVHRFYLGQPGLGILYILLMFTVIFPMVIGLIDCIVFLTMDQDVFDLKYNKELIDHRGRRSSRHHQQRQDRRERERQGRERYEQRRQERQPRRAASSRQVSNPYRERGIQKYKEYDFQGAIEDFKMSLEVHSHDKNVHFILSCAYSLTEQLQDSLFHLDKAVEQGFKDFKKIEEHDALAYLRTQPQYDNFVDNNYRIVKSIEAPKQVEERELDDLILNKIQRLGELKDKGFITDVEFEAQKKKLLG